MLPLSDHINRKTRWEKCNSGSKEFVSASTRESIKMFSLHNRERIKLDHPPFPPPPSPLLFFAAVFRGHFVLGLAFGQCSTDAAFCGVIVKIDGERSSVSRASDLIQIRRPRVRSTDLKING